MIFKVLVHDADPLTDVSTFWLAIGCWVEGVRDTIFRDQDPDTGTYRLKPPGFRLDAIAFQTRTDWGMIVTVDMRRWDSGGPT